MIKKLLHKNAFKGYVETMKSLTQPDEVQSLQTIIQRAMLGMMPLESKPFYDDCSDDEFDEDPTRQPGFEFSDAYALAEETSDNLKRLSESSSEQSDDLDELNKELSEESSANSEKE